MRPDVYTKYVKEDPIDNGGNFVYRLREDFWKKRFNIHDPDDYGLSADESQEQEEEPPKDPAPEDPPEPAREEEPHSDVIKEYENKIHHLEIDNKVKEQLVNKVNEINKELRESLIPLAEAKGRLEEENKQLHTQLALLNSGNPPTPEEPQDTVTSEKEPRGNTPPNP